MKESIRKGINFFYRKFIGNRPLRKLDAVKQVHVIAWCSDFTHLREQLPVMQKLAAFYQVGFITNKNDIAEYIKNHTEIAVGILKFAHAGPKTLAKVIKLELPNLTYALIGNDLREDDKAITLALKQLNIKTGVITHGLNYLNTKLGNGIADELFVWAKEEKKRMEEQGIDSKKINVSGSPYFKYLSELNLNTTASYKLWETSFNIQYQSHNKQKVLIAISGAGHLYTNIEHKATITGLQAIALQLNQTHTFFCKLHRKDQVINYTEAPQLNIVNQNDLFPFISPLVPLILNADVVISGASTGVIEAMILQKPVVIFDPNPATYKLPFVKEQYVFASDSISEVTEQILALQQTQYLEQYLAKQNVFLNQYIFNQNNLAPEELIIQQIKKRHHSIHE